MRRGRRDRPHRRRPSSAPSGARRRGCRTPPACCPAAAISLAVWLPMKPAPPTIGGIDKLFRPFSGGKSRSRPAGRPRAARRRMNTAIRGAYHRWRASTVTSFFSPQQLLDAHEARAGARKQRRDLGQNAVAVAALELNGDHQAGGTSAARASARSAPACAPLAHNVAQQPVDRLRGLEGEGVADERGQARVARRRWLQRGAIDRGDARAPLEGGQRPAARAPPRSTQACPCVGALPSQANASSSFW